MGFLAVLAALIKAGVARVGGAGAAIGIGAGIADMIDLDFFRGETERIVPGSDPDAIEDAARSAARVFGLDGGEGALWPIYQRGPKRGQRIEPLYLVISLAMGRAWFSAHHYSKNSVNAAFKRGVVWGKRSALREAVQMKDIAA